MTRRFGTLVTCPHCKASITAETAFERWMRNHDELDSRAIGLVRFDCDLLLHRYLTPTDKKGTRDLQCLMFVEVKTHGADVSPAQHDTLIMFDQVLKNRRPNMHRGKKGLHAKGHVPPAKVRSLLLKRDVALWMFGGHLLQFSGEAPEDSEWIMWDRRAIKVPQLIALLRFEVDPYDLRPIDWRRRYSDFQETKSQLTLFT